MGVQAGWDALRVGAGYPAAGSLGAPALVADVGALPARLVRYTDVPRVLARADPTAAIHLFEDDYRIERVWNSPDRAHDLYLWRAGAVLSPDFSLYRDWPLACQVWNLYRSRWVGARWRELGHRVIPTASWSDEASLEWALEGLPERSALAVSTVGCARDPEARRLFELGYKELCNSLRPLTVLVYGELFPAHLADLAPVRYYRPDRARMRKGRRS